MEPRMGFNSPEDLEPETNRELERSFEKAVFPGVLVGNWVNVNPGTRGIVKLSIGTAAGPTTTVHLYGACTPTPCDWGSVKGVSYSSEVASPRAMAFTALYSFAFKDAIVTGHLEGQLLVVEVYNRFKDASGRSDYFDKETFHRA